MRQYLIDVECHGYFDGPSFISEGSDVYYLTDVKNKLVIRFFDYADLIKCAKQMKIDLSKVDLYAPPAYYETYVIEQED